MEETGKSRMDQKRKRNNERLIAAVKEITGEKREGYREI